MKIYNSNSTLTKRSQSLRREMTKEERRLWYDFFKKTNYKVHRQKAIGSYMVDFCISSSKIIIEIDGSQHYAPDAKEYDKKRDSFLSSQGFTVLRYTNFDITKNFYGVCEDIIKHIENR